MFRAQDSSVHTSPQVVDGAVETLEDLLDQRVVDRSRLGRRLQVPLRQ